MTAEDREYARLWLSEMWRPVPEWHEPDADRAVHEARNALLSPPVDEARKCA